MVQELHDRKNHQEVLRSVCNSGLFISIWLGQLFEPRLYSDGVELRCFLQVARWISSSFSDILKDNSQGFKNINCNFLFQVCRKLFICFFLFKKRGILLEKIYIPCSNFTITHLLLLLLNDFWFDNFLLYKFIIEWK